MFGTGTGGGFGSTSGTSIFGSSKPAAPTLSISTATPTSIFGSQSNTTSTPANKSLFGASTATTGTTSGGASLFGSTTTPAATGTGTGSAFGNTATSTAAGGSSLFGSTSTGTTGGLFGSTTTSNPTTNTAGNTGGLFGSSGTGAKPGFGASSTTTGFGSNTANTGGGLFGSSMATNTANTGTGSGLFGSSTGSSMFGQNQQQQQQQQQQSTLGGAQAQAGQKDQQEFEQICQQLMFIKECWDPNSPNCQFRHYFYNAVEPSEVHRYQCPPNQDPVLWQMAQRDNPDPSKLVPVLASSFNDLKERVDLQNKQSETYKTAIEVISTKLESLMQNHHNNTLAKLAEARRRHADLSQRLLEFMKSLQLLRLRGQMLRPEEEILRVRIDELDRLLSSPQSLQQSLGDVQNKLYRLQAHSQHRKAGGGWGSSSSSSSTAGGDGNNANGFAQTPELEARLEPVLNALNDQQRATLYLTETTHAINDDMARVEQELDRQSEDARIAY